MTGQANIKEKNARLGRHAVIVGGGLSGLSSAFFLSQKASQEHLPLKITVLEASNRFGGVLRTLTHEGLRMEAGADAFYAGLRKPAVKAERACRSHWDSGQNDATDLCRELGIEEEVVEAAPCFRRFFILKNKQCFPIPGLPDSFFDAARFLTDPRLSFFAKCRMLQEPFIPRRKEKEDESLASFIRRRLGQDFYREAVKPLVQSVYMGDPETLSLRALFPRFEQAERIYGSLAGSFLKRAIEKKEESREEFFTLKHGLEGLIQALVRELESCEDRLSGPRERARTSTCELRRLAPVRQCTYNAGWEISLKDGAVLRADILCLAMNACDSSKLLSTAAPELSRKLAGIRYDSIAAVNLIYKSDDMPTQGLVCEDRPSRPSERAGSIGIPAPGFMAPMDGERFPFSSLKWLGKSADEKYLSMRAFISEAMLPGVFYEDDETLKQKILTFLSDFFGIGAKPLFMDVNRYPGALPQYETGHLERVAEIEEKVLQYPGLYLTGNGFRGFGITDCIRQAKIAVSTFQL